MALQHLFLAEHSYSVHNSNYFLLIPSSFIININYFG